MKKKQVQVNESFAQNFANSLDKSINLNAN